MSGLVARRLGQLVSLLVLVASGTYLLVYLYRWEWNRALVAGAFFVSAEVAIAATAILRRLRAIEAKVDAALSRPTVDQQVLARVQEAAPDRRNAFAWLDDRARSANVFVPVLLGAGVVLSVLAAGVERLASVTAVPALEDRLTRRLHALALPPGGLLGATAPASAITHLDHRPPRRRLDRLVVRVFAVVAAALLVVSFVNFLADETQDGHDPAVEGSMVVTLEVSRRSTGRDPALTAEALFVACRHTIGDRSDATVLSSGRISVVTLVVTPAFGQHAERRLVGCLEDATFDRVSADVVAVERVGD